ncbi:DUF4386 family protein [Cryobacterium sp. SO1]|uniref:DUF4386 family protein n=1 Tax=Cryobacterium sp. SO1 TaxID=1897061 RepID=UPI0010E78E1D|nr:DUF4386 family protein [Cryobacterium sp. SO1]RZI35009.1 hypothetical protein BJQ95_02610 [Cryobacterium sp. SO1]
MTSRAEQASPTAARAAAAWHGSWHPLYRVGGVAALLYVVVLLTAVVLDTLAPPPVTGSLDTLVFIADHRVLYTAGQILWILPGYLAVLVYVAVGIALAPVGRSWALLAGLLGAMPPALSLAIPVSTRGSLILVPLSDRYASAPAEEQPGIVAAAEAVIAENTTVTFTGPLWMIGLLVTALVMTRGVFPRPLGWLGVAVGVLGLAAEVLRFVLPGLYLAALLQWVWVVWTGIVLLRLGARGESGAGSGRTAGASAYSG